jgi:hypothetical protein
MLRFEVKGEYIAKLSTEMERERERERENTCSRLEHKRLQRRDH